MIKVAVYGKGGIGKSTTVSNVAVALAEKGMKVMQIGCDPKADSTILLRHGKKVPTVLELYNEKRQELKLTDMVQIGYGGVVCVEAGGPAPGLGCAGRGIITALEKLKENGAYETYKPDIVFYDVLGDVVCGGFSMPMRNGYADKVFIITSGENMAIHAGANIAMAVDNFRNRGYASLGGVILNRRNVPGVGAKMKGQDLESMVDEKDMARKEAIVLSMTPKERENPDLINPSRKQRIAKGAGVDIAEVNRFIKQFEQSRKMMKQMTGMVGKGGKRGGFKLPF